MEIKLHSLADTKRLAACLAAFLKPGMVVCLSGDLGAGKTAFTQALADALGVQEPVTSPSFTIVHEYHSGRYPLYHMDVYRIEDADELDAFGFDDYFAGKALVVVEWGERVSDLLPENRIRISLRRGMEETERTAQFECVTALEQRLAVWLAHNWKETP